MFQPMKHIVCALSVRWSHIQFFNSHHTLFYTLFIFTNVCSIATCVAVTTFSCYISFVVAFNRFRFIQIFILI